MTILFLARRFYPETGGVERHVFEISKRLLAAGNNVVVLREEEAGEAGKAKTNYQSHHQSDIHYINAKKPVKSIQSEILRSKKINVINLDFGGDDFFKKFRIWQNLSKFQSLFDSSDIIHAHDVFFWVIPFVFLNDRRKFFVTFHGYETNFPPRLGAKVVRRVSDRLASGNISVGKYIEKWYGTKADFITYGGVNAPKIVSPIVKNKNGIKNIVFFGRIDEDNGVKLFLSALKELKKRKIGFKFIAVGDGKMRKKVEKVGKVTGFGKNPQKYLSSADFVFSSSYLSILESLILKKRVIAVFQNDLKKDYLKKSPFAKFIRICDNPGEIVEAIIKPGRGTRGEGYEFATKQTWDKVVKTYLKLWRR